jgi:hypothetical protein
MLLPSPPLHASKRKETKTCWEPIKGKRILEDGIFHFNTGFSQAVQGPRSARSRHEGGQTEAGDGTGRGGPQAADQAAIVRIAKSQRDSVPL